MHILAHTHDDVGWIKTVDEYYTGTDNGMKQGDVNLIISTAVDALMQNKMRKFTYVEMKYFQMWYKNLAEDKKQ